MKKTLKFYSLFIFLSFFFGGDLSFVQAAYQTESQISAGNRVDFFFDELSVNAEEISFTLTLRGAQTDGDDDCVETYRNGIRAEDVISESCAAIRQVHVFSNQVIPANAEIIKATLDFPEESLFQFCPPTNALPGDNCWRSPYLRLPVSFYQTNALEFNEWGRPSSDEIFSGYPTLNRFAFLIRDFRWGYGRLEVSAALRTNYFDPRLASLPIRSFTDEPDSGFNGCVQIMDGVLSGICGRPMVADLIEQGENNLLDDIPDDPAIDERFLYIYNSPRLSDGYNRPEEELSLDLILGSPRLTITYRTEGGGFGHWIGRIYNDLTLRFTVKNN